MKKFVALLLALAMVFALCACGNSNSAAPKQDDAAESSQPSDNASENQSAADLSALKVGFIFLHDENSTYDLNFMNAAKEACETLGVESVFKTNIPEDQSCYEAAAELADAGCNIIFADSFGHEDYIIQAAKEFPEVQFCHSTGTKAHTEGLDCPTATMEVTFTGSWYDETAEKEAANKLIANGCKLISQHADSMGAPTACETAGVPNVSYNGSTISACPNTFIVSSRIDWAPYYEFVINAVANGETVPADWTGTLATGSVVLTEVNEAAAAAGTADKIAEVKAALEAGTIHVFDTANFTVGGETLTSYMADVDTDANYEADTEVILDGYFHESEMRSAPYFDLRIDGITLLDEAY